MTTELGRTRIHCRVTGRDRDTEGCASTMSQRAAQLYFGVTSVGVPKCAKPGAATAIYQAVCVDVACALALPKCALQGLEVIWGSESPRFRTSMVGGEKRLRVLFVLCAGAVCDGGGQHRFMGV